MLRYNPEVQPVLKSTKIRDYLNSRKFPFIFTYRQVAAEALGLGVHEDTGAVSGLIAKLLKEGEITFLGKKDGCSQYMILKPIRSFERPLAKEYKGGKPGRTMGRRPITNINIEEYKEPGSLPVYMPIG